jgi:hypothetical protein
VIDDDPIRGEDAKGTDLISPHQATVALNICGEDRSELSFDGVRFQARLLPSPADGGISDSDRVSIIQAGYVVQPFHRQRRQMD